MKFKLEAFLKNRKQKQASVGRTLLQNEERNKAIFKETEFEHLTRYSRLKK